MHVCVCVCVYLKSVIYACVMKKCQACLQFDAGLLQFVFRQRLVVFIFALSHAEGTFSPNISRATSNLEVRNLSLKFQISCYTRRMKSGTKHRKFQNSMYLGKLLEAGMQLSTVGISEHTKKTLNKTLLRHRSL